MNFSVSDFKQRFSGKRESTMRDRFILRVLLPPFLLLLLIGGVSFWQLNKFLQTQAVDNLHTAATSTAIRLERELAIRETVLKDTAEEIFVIKNTYVTQLSGLEKSRSECRDHYLEFFTFTNSPNNVCDIFERNLGSARRSLSSIEDTYIETAKTLQAVEIEDVNQRLSAFKQFFPETVAVMTVGEDSAVLSSAISGDTSVTVTQLTDIAISALKSPVRGSVLQSPDYKLAVFAFPTSSGSVLAAFDVNDPNYIVPSWESAPIDNKSALAVIIEIGENTVFPELRNDEIVVAAQGIESGKSVDVSLQGVPNVVVGESVANSQWAVLISSPKAIVFEPVYDTRFTLLVITGLLVVGFLWVGTFFIKKTTDSLAQIITGALVFGSGRLDYKLNVDTSVKEFRQLADTMRYMAKRIAQNEQEIDERNKEFISIATHELRAPMTAIIGYLSMFKDGNTKLSKQNALLIDNAYEGTIRLKEMVNDMLDAARLEGGREEFVYEKLDLSKFVNECVESMRVVAKQEEIKLSYNDDNAKSVYADAAKLRIILNNFVSNAIKYNHRKGKVSISHIVNDGNVVTAIANTGPTIPEDQKRHMFEKFFRVDTPEHRKKKGTGVGMYVTKQYIVAMGGKVWFASVSGQDTVFYFSLPIANKDSVAAQQKKTTPKVTNSKWIMRWHRRIK